MQWYLIAVTPTGTHIYPVPSDDEGRAAAIAAARRIHSAPADDVDAVDAAGWDLSLSQGEPHPSLLARPEVTLHDAPPA